MEKKIKILIYMFSDLYVMMFKNIAAFNLSKISSVLEIRFANLRRKDQ